jgi:hypothetical protein
MEILGDDYCLTVSASDEEKWAASYDYYEDYHHFVTGDTPAEALARLWLALNGKGEK